MLGGCASIQDVHNRSMDGAGRNLEGADGDVATAAALAAGEQLPATDADRRLVKIGSNQTVALHGQDRTKKAINEDTTILVQCINRQNWMQVTDTAPLMFCPVCQVVSPVI